MKMLKMSLKEDWLRTSRSANYWSNDMPTKESMVHANVQGHMDMDMSQAEYGVGNMMD